MNNDFFVSILAMASFIMPVIAGVAGLVLGIIVLSAKVKPTKILGLSVLFSSLSTLISGAYTLTLAYGGGIKLARLSVVQSVGAGILLIAVYFCISFYIHKNYGKKYIYIPLILIPFVGRLCSTVVSILINRLAASTDSLPFLISSTSNVGNLIVSVVVTIILIVVFFKNRKIEKIIPHTYIIYIISLAWTVISELFTIVYYELMVFRVMELLNAKFLNDLSLDGYLDMLMIFYMFGALVGLIFPIYLTVMVMKESRKAEIE